MKKNNKSIKIIKCIVLILIIALTVFLIYHKFNSVDVIVVDGRENWDVFSAGDTAMSGEFAGKIYENNYTIDTLPDDYISSLIVDYYLAVTPDFYVEENQKEDFSYQKTISKEEFNKLVDKMLGPDNKVNVVPVTYGCGRFLKIVDDMYIIGSNDPDACGLFSYKNASRYISFIESYQKYKDRIIINLKVAYMSLSRAENDDEEDIYYNAYTDKSKTELITNNYNPTCLYEKDYDESCYEDFLDYQVILKKASDNDFYFYSISKK